MHGHGWPSVIINGDLTKLACDAILIPTDNNFKIEKPWLPLLRRRRLPSAWDGANVVPIRGRGDGPTVWLGNVGRAGDANDAAPYLDVAGAYVEAARRDLAVRRRRRLYPWPNWRIALNVLGQDAEERARARAVFSSDSSGIWRTLPGTAMSTSYWSPTVRSHSRRPARPAHRGRGRDLRDGWMFEPDATPGLISRAERLAEHAINERLVVFLGAGVSAGAGLPDWKALLELLAERAGVSPDQTERLATYDLRDQATYLADALVANGQTLAGEVSKALARYPRYSLAHGLLASLPIGETVTTNYDTLFENAVRIDGRELAVLPDDPQLAHGRWLLKLHGSVDRPERIVLTRSDYMDMPRKYGALMGLVQAMLLMRHMVFVGYSLTDEDFHELVHEVRQARPGAAAASGGTLLTLFDDPISNSLWERDLEIVPMMPEDGDHDYPRAARQLEVFLDLVGYLASTTAPFFLDDAYLSLTEGEQHLREQLVLLHRSTSEAQPGTVGNLVRHFLESLGAPSGHRQSSSSSPQDHAPTCSPQRP